LHRVITDGVGPAYLVAMTRIRLLLTLALLIHAGLLLGQAEVVPGVRLVRGAFVPGTQPDGNSVLFSTKEGLIVMDTGRHVPHTDTVLEVARSAKSPIVAVVNSHWHLDHIGGNAAIRKEFPGVTIYASGALAAARKGFLANYRAQLEDVLKTTTKSEEKTRYRTEIGLIDATPQLAPDVVITAGGIRKIAGHQFYVGLERSAVTAGDVWLLDEATGLLAAGDLVTLPAPFLDTACAPRWRQSLATLDRTGFQLLIPGHGPPLTHRQFDVYRESFSRLLECAESSAAKDVCVNGWLDGTAVLISPAEQTFTRGLMNYYVDALRRPAAERAKLCAVELTP
jgi:glyoxylase-like metal-dependent hydrolase (beta-lactamase superfamily II)